MNAGEPRPSDSVTLGFRSSENLVIVADDRERGCGVLEELGRQVGVRVEVDRIGVGDYLVGDHFIVERKTLRDFAASVVDSRWFRQIAGMICADRSALVVLEGAGSGALPVTRDALQGALITATVFYGVPVLRAKDPAETARLLVYLGRQAQRHAAGSLPRSGYRPKGRRARQLFILQGLPGIGPDRAARLLEHFGSVQQVFAATLEDLAAVAGIGTTTAARIRWAAE